MEKLFDTACTILKTISRNEDFVEPQINCYAQVGKEQGFLGDIFFVRITEKNSDKKLDLIVKQATASEYVQQHYRLDVAYSNEIIFYKNIWPEFLKFQKLHLKSLLFDNMAVFYEANMESGKECLILENLKSQGFSNLEKNSLYDQEHAELVLKKYGQFHGLSFAYKSKNPNKFQALSELLTPYWDTISRIELFENFLEQEIKDCLSYLNPSEEFTIIEKLKKYQGNEAAIFRKSLRYNGKLGAILQGDCWSNNVLFKYDDSGKLNDIKLIDFQMSNLGSVVNDLSYFLYAGGTQEIFNNFDHYLKIYHDSVSDICLAFGCTDFMSFAELKQEWKEYCKFGFLLGLQVVIKNKFLDDQCQDEMNAAFVEKSKSDKNEEYKKKFLELVYQMHENDFL